MYGKAKKSAKNNQWATQAKVGKTCDHNQKTEFSNEWATTNKNSSEPMCQCDHTHNHDSEK